MLAQGVMGGVLKDMAQAEDSTDSWSEDALLLGLLSLGLSQGRRKSGFGASMPTASPNTCLFSSVTERESRLQARKLPEGVVLSWDSITATI